MINEWEYTEEGKRFVHKYLSIGSSTLIASVKIKRTSKDYFDVQMTSWDVLIKKATVKLRKGDTLNLSDMEIRLSSVME